MITLLLLASNILQPAQWCVRTVWQGAPDIECNRKVVTVDTVTQPTISTATAARKEMLAQAALLQARGGITAAKIATEAKRISLSAPASMDYGAFTLWSDTPGNRVEVIFWWPK